MRDLEYPWDVLDLEPTTDKKSIKKAYAILLKKYKPDEFPSEFQQIQQAYQLALNWVKQAARHDDNQVNKKINNPTPTTQKQYKPKNKHDESSEFNNNTSSNINKRRSVNTEELADDLPIDEVKLEEDNAIQLRQKLMAQIHALAFSPIAVKNNLSNWNFIQESLIDLDIQHMRLFAIDVFEKVAEYNLFQMRQNKTLLISAKIFRYLNSLFDWNDLLNNYNYQYSDEVYYVTFYYLEANDKDNFNRTYSDSFRLIKYRIGGQIVDLTTSIVLFYLMVIGFSMFDLYFSIVDNYAGLIILTLYNSERVLLELITSNHSSLGKLVSKQIIIDRFGNYADNFTLLKRHLIFQINLLPFYLNSVLSEKQAITLFDWSLLLIIIVNVYFLIRKKGFIHDYLSGTMVTRIETHTDIS
jgi:hypothetical protein